MGWGPGKVSGTLKLGLAPMEGVSELPTRLWLSQTSRPDICTTPFLRVTTGFPTKKVPRVYGAEFGELKSYVPFELCPQLMTAQVDDFVRLAESQLERGAAIVEVNCGCPSPVVVGNGAGSALLETAEKFWRFVGGLHAALGDKVAVKMRTGFVNETEFEMLLLELKSMGLARLTVHGRTRADRYLGKARWGRIADASQLVSAPVYGSGDVNDSESYESALKLAPHVAGIFVGRGALRNPWIFTELRTGKRVQISLKALRAALETFVWVQELSELNSAALIEAVKQGAFAEYAGVNEEIWERHSRYFKGLLNKEPGWERVSRGSLSKLKMLWNYLRSSLPDVFFDARFLRSSQFFEFLEVFDEVSLSLPESHIELWASSRHDWIYSGGGKSGGAASN